MTVRRPLHSLAILTAPWWVIACQSLTPSGTAPSKDTAPLSARALLQEGAKAPDSQLGRKKLFEALRQFRATRDKAGAAESLYLLAQSHERAQLYPSALQAVASARKAYAKSTGHYDLIEARHLEASLHLRLEHSDRALLQYEELYQQARTERSTTHQWQSLVGLGQAATQLLEFELASQAFETSLSLATQATRAEQARILQSYAESESAHGHWHAARLHFSLALSLVEKSALEQPQRIVRAGQLLLSWGRMEFKASNYAASLLAATQALAALSLPNSAGRGQNDSKHRIEELSKKLKALLSETTSWLAIAAQSDFLDRPVSAAQQTAMRRIDAQHWVLKRQLLEDFIAMPSQLLTSAHLIPNLDIKPSYGVTVFGVREHTLWGQLGFENGDRLVSINGYSWADLHSLSIVDLGFSSAARIVVALERNSTTMQIEYQLE